jgi:pimeloyl-ACP methyl ester carboxylesterase
MDTATRTEARSTTAREATPAPTRSRPSKLRRNLRRPRYLLPATGLAVVGVYLLVLRPLLMPSGRTAVVELAVVLVLALAFAMTLAWSLVLGLVSLVTLAIPRVRSRSKQWLGRTARSAVTALALSVALIVAVLGTQWLAYSPPIRDADGNGIQSSIASLEKVELLGSEQWITIRGTDVDNPVLLFLAGGPGGSELAMTRGWADNLADDFVVVNWDQPGAGKSWNAVPIETLTPERYVAYAHELVLQLRERFDERRIYLLGESWGAALGVMLVQRYPGLFHAYIGSAQMVAFLENDTLEYEADLRYAREQGDAAMVATLEDMGPPPYTEDPAGKMMTMASSEFARTEAFTGSDYELFTATLRAPEYGVAEKIRSYFSGLQVFNTVYPQLYGIDFRTQASRLEVPVYFLHGRHDINAMPSLILDYYRVLEAPHKELIWFERSGHNVLPEEPGKVQAVLSRIVAAMYDER